ncbi:MAG: saccharopine dehydrogenase NADP-binding domain-containing protein, partial [Clostridiales bacterium]|nr:saccharopine dehydrogenase NADP-binding domain-containing protein [Clostridiales bacterium]
MKKILIIGCTEVTDVIVPLLCKDPASVSELSIASLDKAECDEYRKKYAGSPVRITTARMDVKNTAGSKMMLSITQPELIINLTPPELSITVMKLALDIGADYIDNELYEWNQSNLLSKQFENFTNFRVKNLMAICGCAFNPSALTAFVRLAKEKRFDEITSADILEVNMKSANEVSDIRDIVDSMDFQAETEKAILIEDGKKKEVAPLSVKIEVDLPGSGKKELFILNDPIVEDFVMEIPEVPNVRYFSTFEKKTDERIELLKETGMLSKEPIEIAEGVKIAPIDFLAKVMPVDHKKSVPTGVSETAVIISGLNKGEEKTVRVQVSMDNTECFEENGVSVAAFFDAIALLAGVKLICRGKWKKAGVFSVCA